MNIYLVFFMIKWIIGPHLLASALQNLENHKVLLEDPVRPYLGSWAINQKNKDTFFSSTFKD